jgi:hypothetical protein
MSEGTREWHSQRADPPLPGGRPRAYLGDPGAAAIVAVFLLFAAFLVLYTCSTALGI